MACVCFAPLASGKFLMTSELYRVAAAAPAYAAAAAVVAPAPAPDKLENGP